MRNDSDGTWILVIGLVVILASLCFTITKCIQEAKAQDSAHRTVWRATPWSLTYGPAPVTPPESQMQTCVNSCFRGPGVAVYTRDACGGRGTCGAFDLDGDGDVDLGDVAIAQVRYGR